VNVISLTAPAAENIFRAWQAGELELHGLLLRDSVGKKFRYILRGLENLPADAGEIAKLPSLGPLRAAMSVQQIMGAVAIAQNTANALALARIEQTLGGIELQLKDMTQRLGRLQLGVDLVWTHLQDQPVNRLRVAVNQWEHGRRHGDQTSMIAACTAAETAARDLLSLVNASAHQEDNGIPFALLAPTELIDLARSAHQAGFIACTMHAQLGAPDAGIRLAEELCQNTGSVRSLLAKRVRDPEFMLRRIAANLADDDALIALGRALATLDATSASVAVAARSGLPALQHDSTSCDASQIEAVTFVEVPPADDAYERRVA
jgi:hypothetical protein